MGVMKPLATRTTKVTVPRGAKLFFEHNLSLYVRAQPAAHTYSAAITYNGADVLNSPGAKSRQEAEERIKEGLKTLGLSLEQVETLVEILDCDAKGKILRGMDSPSSTIHLTVG